MSSSAQYSDDQPSNAAAKLKADVSRKIQYYLDKSTPHPTGRWIGTLVVLLIYALRVYYLKGFYIVTYGLGIYILNLLIGFLSPQADPEGEGPALPSKTSDEFKPFIRRLPEFKFWYSLSKAFLVAFVLTFLPMFDVPVFWPILLVYWLTLFVLTMKRQIRHMIKYKYVPFSFGKQKYKGKRGGGGGGGSGGVGAVGIGGSASVGSRGPIPSPREDKKGGRIASSKD